MTVERADLERILHQIERVQSNLDSIRTDVSTLLGETVFAPPNYLLRPLKLWRKIKEVGETVTEDQLRVIAKSVRYDPRALGGFFGGPNSSLVKLGNGKIGLRQWASQEVGKYKEWLDSQQR